MASALPHHGAARHLQPQGHRRPVLVPCVPPGRRSQAAAAPYAFGSPAPHARRRGRRLRHRRRFRPARPRRRGHARTARTVSRRQRRRLPRGGRERGSGRRRGPPRSGCVHALPRHRRASTRLVQARWRGLRRGRLAPRLLLPCLVRSRAGSAGGSRAPGSWLTAGAAAQPGAVLAIVQRHPCCLRQPHERDKDDAAGTARAGGDCERQNNLPSLLAGAVRGESPARVESPVVRALITWISGSPSGSRRAGSAGDP